MMGKLQADWPWWYSRDEGRWAGPCATRDEAVREGHDDYGDGEPFMVCQATQGEYHLRFDLRDELENHNDELIAPERGLWDQATKEQWAELSADIEAAIRAWAQRHGFSTQAWAFVDQGPIETVPGEDDGALARDGER